MFHSILVPLDGFPFGEHALPLALSLAQRLQVPLRLVHVIQPFVEVVPELTAYQGPMEAEYRLEKQKYLEDVVRRLHEASEVKVTFEILEGDIAPTLREAVVRGQSELVVMTTHGRGPLARFWLGSVTDALIRELPVPLLLVHPAKDPADFTARPVLKQVLLPLDGTPLAEQIIPPAAALGQAMGSELTLLRVIRTELPPDFGYQYRGGYVATQARELAEQLEAVQKRQKQEAENYLQSVASRIRSLGLTASIKVVLDEAPAVAILHEAAGLDLVALETHGYSGLKRLWLGSVADKIIRGSSVPVLVHRPVP